MLACLYLNKSLLKTMVKHPKMTRNGELYRTLTQPNTVWPQKVQYKSEQTDSTSFDSTFWFCEPGYTKTQRFSFLEHVQPLSHC